MTDPHGYLSVSFPVMEQGAQDLTRVHAQLASTLEELEVRLARSLQDWSSDAQQAYAACQQRWQADANEMASHLREFGQFVERAKDHYLNTEARNTGIWS